MTIPRLRHLLLKCYFPVAFVVAVALLILDTITPPVVAQVRTVTVTVFVTVVQTVPVYVPVTAYVTIASVATSFITFTSTAVSISLGTVTLLNTISLWNTVTTAPAGILGPMPANIFGQYSDLALVGGGLLGGVAAGVASSSLIGKWTLAPARDGLFKPSEVKELSEKKNSLIRQRAGSTTSETIGEADSEKHKRRRKPD